MKIGILHTAFIGDVILSGLLVEALFVAGYEIVYFTKKKTSIIFAADERVKKVIEIEKGRGLNKMFALKKIAAQIQQEQLDVLLVPHRSATSTLCAYFANVKLTIGFQNAALSFLYKNKVPFHKKAHECVRYLALLQPTFIDQSIITTHTKLARPILKYSKNSYIHFEQKFASFQFTQPHLPIAIPFTQVKENFFILAVGSVWKTKKYPIEQWVEVIFQFLLTQSNYYCVLTGSQADKEDMDLFIKLFSTKCTTHRELVTKIICASNLFNLFEFALFTSFAKFVLSNDSSPVHFASAFNIPVLAIFGPTVPEFGFAPTSAHSITISYLDEKEKRLPCQPCSIHGKNICPQKHFKCMKELSTKTVSKGIERLLSVIK